MTPDLISSLAATFVIVHDHMGSLMRRIGRNPETATVCCRLLFSDNSKEPERAGHDHSMHRHRTQTTALVVSVDLRFLQEAPPGPCIRR